MVIWWPDFLPTGGALWEENIDQNGNFGRRRSEEEIHFADKVIRTILF